MAESQTNQPNTASHWPDDRCTFSAICQSIMQALLVSLSLSLSQLETVTMLTTFSYLAANSSYSIQHSTATAAHHLPCLIHDVVCQAKLGKNSSCYPIKFSLLHIWWCWWWYNCTREENSFLDDTHNKWLTVVLFCTKLFLELMLLTKFSFSLVSLFFREKILDAAWWAFHKENITARESGYKIKKC